MITKSVVLKCPPQRAFNLVTQQAGLWWPPDRRHTPDAHSEIRMEASGRFFERSSDGTEVELGIVVHFEPGMRLVLDWYPGTDPSNPTQVEITFEPVDVGTLVTVQHSPGVAGDEIYARKASAYKRSWDLVLAALAAHTTPTSRA